MVYLKTLILIQSLLLSQCVFGQQPTPNATLPVPGPLITSLEPSEVLLASEITVSASSTIFEIIDSDPAVATATFTMAISPSGISVHAVNVDDTGEEDLDDTCTVDGDTATCELVVVAKVNNVTGTVTVPSTSTFTQGVSSLPVVALNFQTTPEPTLKNSAAIATQVSIATSFAALVSFALIYRRLV